MKVGINISVPPNRCLFNSKIDDRTFSVLLGVILDAFENGSIQKRLKEQENELDAESDILFRLEQTISTQQARMFKQILRKHHISEQDICKKYGADDIEELTGSDVLDVLAEIVLANKDRNQ